MEPPAEADDLEAIRAVLTGNREAFRLLIDKYGASIFSLALRMTGDVADAEELAQEAFLKAYTALPSFRVGARFHPWLYTIALNLCRNHLRRKALVKWVPLVATQADRTPRERDWPDPSPGPERALLDREGEERLLRALGALPPKYREVFLLRQSEGLSYRAIAEVTGLPLGTVEVRLFRARRLLLKALEAGGPGVKRNK
jgi:RNA polymerase sigma-70 factor (ECF subfamily)